MWLSLLRLALALNLSISFAYAASPSTGPTSSAEAQILWKDSQSLYESGDYEGALPKLRRLLDRYPAYPDAARYRELRFQLGRAYLELGQPAKAVTQFRSYLEGTGIRPHTDSAKLLLTEAYLKLKRFNEAYLSSLELESHPSPEIQNRALLVRARAMIGLNQDTRAQKAADSALRGAEQLKSAELLGASNSLILEIKTRACAQLPGKGRWTEAQTRARLDQRGECLSEAMIVFQRTLATNDASASDRALELIGTAYRDYRSACENPPDPPRLKPKDRTPEQLKTYRVELIDSLRKLCGERLSSALTMISVWKQEDPAPSESIRMRLQKLEETLR